MSVPLNQRFAVPKDAYTLSTKYAMKNENWSISASSALQHLQGHFSSEIELNDSTILVEKRYSNRSWDMKPTLKRRLNKAAVGLSPAWTMIFSEIDSSRHEKTLFSPSLFTEFKVTEASSLEVYFNRNANLSDLNLLIQSPQITSHNTSIESSIKTVKVLSNYSVLANLRNSNIGSLSSYDFSFLWSDQVSGVQLAYELDDNNLLTKNKIGKGPELLIISAGFDRYLSSINSSIRIRSSFSKSTVPLSFDSELLKTKLNVVDFSAGLVTSSQNVLNFSVSYLYGSSWSNPYRETISGYEKALVRIQVKPGKNLYLNLYSTSIFVNGSLDTHFVNFQGKLRLTRRTSIGLEGINLLNQKEFSITETNNQLRISNELELIPRYVLLKVETQF